MLTLVSTTICKNNEELIQEALCSVVDYVDCCVLIDTGSTDQTVARAKDVAGDKLIVYSWPWQNDFAAARNEALARARALALPNTWALTLDSDERIHWTCTPVELQAALTQANTSVFSMYQRDGTYEKPRILATSDKSLCWVGPTHEYLNHSGKSATFAQATFYETPKSSTGYLHKFERDVQILQNQVQKYPTESRWHFYLGDSYRNLGLLEEAVRAYETCAALRGWDEEGAWACYRAAEIRGTQGRREEAIDLCARGLARHPGIAELAWLAGLHSYYLGQFQHAIHWSRMAVLMGAYCGYFVDTGRISFRDLPALYEGPYDVLRFAFRALGREEEADAAEQHWHKAKLARENHLR